MSHLRLRPVRIGPLSLSRLVAVLVIAAGFLSFGSIGSAASTSLVINEVDYDQPSTDTAEFFELKNVSGAPINLDAYRVELVNGNGNVLYQTIDLPNVDLAPGGYFVVCGNSANTNPCHLDHTTNQDLIQNGAPDGMKLVTGTDPVVTVDAVSYEGNTGLGATEGSGDGLVDTAAASPAGAESISRCPDGSDADQNNVDFSLRPFSPGAANSCPGPPPENQPVTVSCGGALSALQGDTATRQVTATDPDGTVTGLTATVTPAAAGISISSQTPAGAVGGTASATVSVSGSVAPGNYTVQITASNADGTPQTGTCSFTVSITEIKPIGQIQGNVGAAANGLTHRSPFAPPTGNSSGTETVVVRGVVYQKTLAKTTNPAAPNQHGFFIQNTPAQADGDPFTSDGIWVFLGNFTTVLNAVTGQPAYTPQVGDEIILSGRISEFFNFTQISSPRFVRLTGTAFDLDATVPATTVDPPADLLDANRYWERLESMRLRVPAGSLVTDGLDVFPSTADAEMWVVRGDSEIAQRSGYAQRVFRDAHPLDDEPGLVDNGNGFRILVGALGLKSLAGDNTVLLPPSRTFDTVGNTLVGGLNFTFSKYRIETNDTPSLTHGIEPALNAPPTAGNRGVEYSVGDYNVENLYDYRNDPFDGCDFAGDLGCTGVNPPFDYVPASDAAYQERLGLIAQQIVGDLHAPDILLLQEAEDQDLCAVVGGALDCDDGVNNRDGKPDTLQELALRIKAQSGIAYDAAFDRDGSDDRGIVAALMYRTDRVELLPATADHPVLGSTPEIEYVTAGNAYNSDVQNPKALNAPLPPAILALPSNQRDGVEVYTRDPQVGLFRVWRTAVGVGAWTDVYAISNHFSSTPDGRVLQRTEQAAYLAEIVETLDAERVVTGGDFNVFPRPDDPLVPASDQLRALYEHGLHSVWETMVAENPAAAYSYVFVGQAQTLDWQFLTPTLHDELVQSRVAHVNADYPAEFAGDGARGLSDHDPMASRFEIPTTLAGLEALLAYYCDTGAIVGANTCKQLQQHLELVPRAGDDQLQAFIGQVRDKTPRFITPTAAGALVLEAQLLLEGN